MKTPTVKFPVLLRLSQAKASGRKSFKLDKTLNLTYQCGLESRDYCYGAGERWQMRNEKTRLGLQRRKEIIDF